MLEAARSPAYESLRLGFSVAVVLLGLGAAPVLADFHFTITADPRDYHTAYGNVLQAINDKVGGPGAFHVAVGDIDNTIPDNRAQVDTKFGASALWYATVGNHEAETAGDMTWVRDEYLNGNGVRTALKNSTLQNGPTGSVETTYSWDFGNAHFINLNEYWNGGTAAGSDMATDGDVVLALKDWLAADLAANTKPFVFVFGHEPAFPQHNHIGDSLDEHVANRDAFWSLLESEGVQAYFNGHTHYFSSHQGDKNGLGNVWQFDAGNAGNDTGGDGKTFLDVIVGQSSATVNVWRDGGTGTFSLADTFTLTPEPATLCLLGLGAAGLALRSRRRQGR